MKTAPKNNLTEKKARMSLLPMDLLRKHLVPAYEEGVVKYERESWRQGFEVSVMVDACMRHIEEFFWQGENIDPDAPNGKHHLGGAIFCLLSILHTMDTRPELDDRYKKRISLGDALRKAAGSPETEETLETLEDKIIQDLSEGFPGEDIEEAVQDAVVSGVGVLEVTTSVSAAPAAGITARIVKPEELYKDPEEETYPGDVRETQKVEQEGGPIGYSNKAIYVCPYCGFRSEFSSVIGLHKQTCKENPDCEIVAYS
jgi:hypothetical protein